MAENDNEKEKHGEFLSPRQSFADGSTRRRRREPQLQTPVSRPRASDHRTESSGAADTAATPGEVLMTWRVDRVRERPLISLVVVVILLGLFAWLWFFTGSWVTALFLTGVVIVSLSQFLFPTTFTLHENGLSIFNIRKEYKPWSRFEVMRVYPDAVQIGPRVTGVKARWNKGTLVYFGRADRDRITEVIREKLGLTEKVE